MSLKCAVLSLLARRRSYGYDLVQELSDRLGPAWQLSASTVYAALEQLEREGLIRVCAERQGDHPPGKERRGNRRVVYEATEAGREALAEQAGRSRWQPEPVRGELYLRVAVAREDELPALLAAVEQAERLTEGLRDDCLEEPRAERGGAWERAVSALARMAALTRLEAELRWLRLASQTLRAEGDEATALASDLMAAAAIPPAVEA